MTDGADVIQLHPRSPDDAAPLTAKPRDPARPRPRECGHPKTVIDPDERRVTCRDCGEVVDAFDTLLVLAQADGRWREARDAAEREARLAQGRLDDLRKAEREASGRIGRLRDRERELEAQLRRLDAELRAFTPGGN
jgi:hypothetical protein